MTISPKITPDDAGCWFAGASHRTADELNALVVLAALDRGWTPDDADELRELAERTDTWLDDPTESEWINDAGWDAAQYLDTLAPAGYSFMFDDGFYLLPVCAQEGYDERDVKCPHGDDCPNEN